VSQDATPPGSTRPFQETPFARGLSDEFLGWLSRGSGRRLLDAFVARELDVRLRGDYLNAYAAGRSIARVEWKPRLRAPVLKIHRKYLVEAAQLIASGSGDYRAIDLSGGECEEYCRSLPGILRAAARHAGQEEKWEELCIRRNLEGTPLVVIDRQIANGRPLVRLDLLAVSTPPESPALVAVELKRGLDNRIQHVANQTLQYVRMLDPTGEGLRDDVASCYRVVCQQLRDLGFRTCSPEVIRAKMPVLGLVALAQYDKPKSQLLPRALAEAGRLERSIRFCYLTGDQPTLPGSGDWFSELPGPGSSAPPR
jgi:hypothetical protein